MEPRSAYYRFANGEKPWRYFSSEEMEGRLQRLRSLMARESLDAVVLTSYHAICYYSGWLYCGFGRRYALVVDGQKATTLSAGIDGGQPYRRSYGDNLVYTDWHRDNHFRALAELLGGARRVGFEGDHLSVVLHGHLVDMNPSVSWTDLSVALMSLRLVKSVEEQALIREGARIADLGGAACREAIAQGVPEYAVARASTRAMEQEIGESFPFVELMDTWTWFQSGINTDGAHNPVTNRRLKRGDLLSLNCFPMLFGYYTALERTMVLGAPSAANLRIWEQNVAVYRRGLELIVPGARCCDIAQELNRLYRDYGLLSYRSFGYGHSFGVLCHYYGRESALELREDNPTELAPGMVISMEPMVTIPEGEPGAGGYREHDILIVTDEGAENITGFPVGPEHNIID